MTVFVAKALPKLEEWEHNLVEGKPTWMRDIDGDKRPDLAADGRLAKFTIQYFWGHRSPN